MKAIFEEESTSIQSLPILAKAKKGKSVTAEGRKARKKPTHSHDRTRLLALLTTFFGLFESSTDLLVSD